MTEVSSAIPVTAETNERSIDEAVIASLQSILEAEIRPDGTFLSQRHPADEDRQNITKWMQFPDRLGGGLYELQEAVIGGVRAYHVFSATADRRWGAIPEDAAFGPLVRMPRRPQPVMGEPEQEDYELMLRLPQIFEDARQHGLVHYPLPRWEGREVITSTEVASRYL